MYQNVADQELTAGEAANFIVSQMKAYNMTAGESEHIIDAVNEVSNRYAVSSADIATNIGKASAAMATGNVTYEQSIGLTYRSIKIGLIAGNPLELFNYSIRMKHAEVRMCKNEKIGQSAAKLRIGEGSTTIA